jgi:hypothetical protein
MKTLLRFITLTVALVTLAHGQTIYRLDGNDVLTSAFWTEANQNVLDAAFGPSIRSSLASRGQGQGIATAAGAYSTVTIPAFGKSAFSVRLKFSQPFGNGLYALLRANTNGFSVNFYSSTTHVLVTAKSGITEYLATSAISENKVVDAVYVRATASGDATVDGVGTWYINGKADTTSADLINYAADITGIGGYGTVLDFTPYNYSLSEAQVRQLAESGLSPSDLPATPAGTQLIAGANNDDSDFGSDTGFWTKGSGATISANSAHLSGAGSALSKLGLQVAGSRYRATVNITSLTGDVYAGNLSGAELVSFNTTGLKTFEYVCSVAGNFGLQMAGAGSCNFTNVTLTPIGALAAYSDQPGIGKQLHDITGNLADLTLASGTSFARPATVGSSQVRATLTWAGTHEAKSLLGQVSLPANAVITSIITTASAGSTGSGLTIGSVTTPNLFVAANVFTTAKKVHTLAAQLPAGTATNDLNLVIDPDTANFTGTIQVAVNYTLAN